jgi:hypothetical protein
MWPNNMVSSDNLMLSADKIMLSDNILYENTFSDNKLSTDKMLSANKIVIW